MSKTLQLRVVKPMPDNKRNVLTPKTAWLGKQYSYLKGCSVKINELSFEISISNFLTANDIAIGFQDRVLLKVEPETVMNVVVTR